MPEISTRTHRAVVTAAVRAPLQVIQVETVSPGENEVLVRIEYVASTPLDLHQNDGGLLVTHPQILGDSIAGTVVEVGAVHNLSVGDKVFGFGWREQKEKAHQEYATMPEYLLGKIPAGFEMQEAVTLPGNFVTVYNLAIRDLEIPLPWPCPPNPSPQDANSAFLIWGGSSSVGIFALQILRYYGYRNLVAVSSKRHHEYLISLGASHVFDYQESDVVDQILEAKLEAPSGIAPAIKFKYIIDCIGSKSGSLAPIARIADKGSKVAVLLPIIVRDSTETTAPLYEMDASTQADWKSGVIVKGVRTHYYLEDDFLKRYLQPTIMPSLLANGVVKPNRQRIVKGKTLLDRAQGALDALRQREVSGERLVWRIPDDDS